MTILFIFVSPASHIVGLAKHKVKHKLFAVVTVFESLQPSIIHFSLN